MNTLDIDAGNTRLKWRLSVDGKSVLQGALDNTHADDYAAEISSSINIDVGRCRISSVRAPEVVNELASALQMVFGVVAEQPRPQSGVGGLIVDKVDPGRLGCDRWLAMLGGKVLYPDRNLMIVDSGTALTVDVVSADGYFQGGLICPGLKTMLWSMTESADLLVLPERPECHRALAHESVQSVQNGALSMAVALIEKESERIEGDVTVVLCGGDAPVLAESLNIPVQYQPDIVFKGLEVALPVQG